MYLHGGDYNPEQWIGDMDLVRSDIKKLKEANINTVTIGMFSWSILEPKEGEFNFEWLKEIFSVLKDNNMNVIMGTPTAARPHWLAQKYAETSRVNANGVRELSGFRHNHCMQSPVFREKAEIIISKLIEAVQPYNIVHSWHINNEFGGQCFCNHCIEKFQNELCLQYGTVENLNKSWWNTFWSHNYSCFSEILPPFNHGENSNTPLNINWEKFKTVNHMDYYKFEYDLIRKFSDLPISTNFHGDPFAFSLDYSKFSESVDYLSYDIYPPWNSKDNFEIAIQAKKELIMQQSLDINKDFYIMESTPGSTNWQDYTTLKTDKLHNASTLLQMLCGSKAFLYFQLKQSRGSSEKYHGAVLDVSSNSDGRVYQYTKQFGKHLLDLKEFEKSKLKREVAIYYDWNNLSMLHFSEGPRNKGLHISEFNDKLVEYFNNVGINVDYVYDDRYLDQYHTIILPYAYNVKPEVVNYLQNAKGIRVIAFPLLNYVDNNDLLHQGLVPNGLAEQFGINVTEFNAVVDGAQISSENYNFEILTEVVKIETAKVIEQFNHEILEAAVTINEYNDSDYIYIGGIPTDKSLETLFDKIFDAEYQNGNKVITSNLIIDDAEYKMLINFGNEVKNLDNVVWSTSENVEELSKFECAIVKNI